MSAKVCSHPEELLVGSTSDGADYLYCVLLEY